MRNSVINACELASYDQYKQYLTQSGIMEEGTPCYLTCAFGAGFNAVIFGSPLDICTTRQMNNPRMYKGPIDVMLKLLKNEGPTVFYKGFIPNVARLGGYNMVLWTTIENIKKHMN
jgi:solute carrier family 25 uncoupling protein 8/9